MASLLCSLSLLISSYVSDPDSSKSLVLVLLTMEEAQVSRWSISTSQSLSRPGRLLGYLPSKLPPFRSKRPSQPFQRGSLRRSYSLSSIAPQFHVPLDLPIPLSVLKMKRIALNESYSLESRGYLELSDTDVKSRNSPNSLSGQTSKPGASKNPAVQHDWLRSQGLSKRVDRTYDLSNESDLAILASQRDILRQRIETDALPCGPLIPLRSDSLKNREKIDLLSAILDDSLYEIYQTESRSQSQLNNVRTECLKDGRGMDKERSFNETTELGRQESMSEQNANKSWGKQQPDENDDKITALPECLEEPSKTRYMPRFFSRRLSNIPRPNVTSHSGRLESLSRLMRAYGLLGSSTSTGSSNFDSSQTNLLQTSSVESADCLATSQLGSEIRSSAESSRLPILRAAEPGHLCRSASLPHLAPQVAKPVCDESTAKIEVQGSKPSAAAPQPLSLVSRSSTQPVPPSIPPRSLHRPKTYVPPIVTNTTGSKEQLPVEETERCSEIIPRSNTSSVRLQERSLAVATLEIVNNSPSQPPVSYELSSDNYNSADSQTSWDSPHFKPSQLALSSPMSCSQFPWNSPLISSPKGLYTVPEETSSNRSSLQLPLSEAWFAGSRHWRCEDIEWNHDDAETWWKDISCEGSPAYIAQQSPTLSEMKKVVQPLHWEKKSNGEVGNEQELETHVLKKDALEGGSQCEKADNNEQNKDIPATASEMTYDTIEQERFYEASINQTISISASTTLKIHPSLFIDPSTVHITISDIRAKLNPNLDLQPILDICFDDPVEIKVVVEPATPISEKRSGNGKIEIGLEMTVLVLPKESREESGKGVRQPGIESPCSGIISQGKAREMDRYPKRRDSLAVPSRRH